MEAIMNFIQQTGFYQIATGDWKVLIMMVISFVLLYLAIVKKFEPLLLLPIAFGMLITNLPGAGMYHEILFAGGHPHWAEFGGAPITQEFLNELSALGVSDAVLGTVQVGETISVGLIDVLYLGVKLGIYPCLIFMGVGASTDFGPLIANPKTLLLGAAAQLGIFMTFVGCRLSSLFSEAQAASIGIIGGADGPTAIFVTSKLAPELLGPIAVAAYSYMALVPVIQPPIMRALTTAEERRIVMRPLREVSRREKIIFPIMVTVFVALLVPSAGPLIACLMLGNLFKDHLPGHLRGRHRYRHHLPVPPDHRYYVHGRRRLWLRHRRRCAPGQVHEPLREGEDQPPHRLRRRLRRAHGRPGLPGGGPEGQPRQLPAHARYGSQRGRRHRLRHRGRCADGPVWLIERSI